jgi:hypothetical protein
MTRDVPLPVQTVLMTTRRHGVRALLMGGQACILYGASEFSRDVDLAVYAAPENLNRLNAALTELQATVAAVPPYTPQVLARGHAVHFHCGAAGQLRLDVMSVMRKVAPFEECWERRSIKTLEGVGDVDIMGLEDLVVAKKTRSDKDWPMVRRLVDVHYSEFANSPTVTRVNFWLRELRTPEALIDCVRRAPAQAATIAATRHATARAIEVARTGGSLSAVRIALVDEEVRERADDEAYWRPLLREQEVMRRVARRTLPPPYRP